MHPSIPRCLQVVMLTLLLAVSARALPTTSVLIENLVAGDPAPSALLVDSDGTTALTAGTADNGDGAVLALGYFTGANFSGTWVPLTGPASANVPLRTTTIGDTNSGAAGSYGFFTIQVNFDQANSATFQNIPAADTQLAVAIYNRTSIGGSTHFNIATNTAWRWKTPALLPDLVRINLNDAGTEWFSGAASARTTSVALATFPGVVPPARLINISTRGFVGTGDSLMIPGFVVAGSGNKTVLVRAVGPTLSSFGVGGVLADPQLSIRDAGGKEIAANDNWSDQPNAAAVAAAIDEVQAFAIPPGSKDAALVLTLPAGASFTAHVTGVGNTTGVVIAEVYVADDEATPATRLSNLSTRGFVGTGDGIMIPGFVLGGGSNRRLLVRAVGPTLGTLGVSGVIADPVLRIQRTSDGVEIASNDNWEDAGQGVAIAAAAASVFAFPLNAGSKDAALILDAPGSVGYTVQVSGADGGTGIAITEVYELP